jgi:CHAT domain-containing protein
MRILEKAGRDAEAIGLAQELMGKFLPMTAEQLTNCLGGSLPSLVYLNCCHSARTAYRHSLQYSKSLGLVDALADAGVPAAIGNRWPVTDTPENLEFVKEFYSALLREFSVERAILHARQKLRAHDTVWASSVALVQYPEA